MDRETSTTEKRSSDIAAVLAYTWSKSLDDKSAPAGIGATRGFAGHLNDRNPGLDYARSDFDVGQRLVASYVYSLLIRRGKKLLTTASRGVDAAVSG